MDRELFNRSSGKLHRREHRNEMPKAEQILWNHLRDKRLGEYKFRRQQGIGPYIVDFYCPSIRLIIEVDGDSHVDPHTVPYDAQREAYFISRGLRVIRFSNTEVYEAIDDVINKIRKHLDNDSSKHSSNPLQLPLEKGEGHD